MEAELKALEAALSAPERPVVAVVGGAKVSTKLDLLGNLVGKVDMLAIGGAMANTFLHALGTDIGKSLCEHDMADTARDILGRADEAGCQIILPSDAVVATEFAEGAPSEVVPVTSGEVVTIRLASALSPLDRSSRILPKAVWVEVSRSAGAATAGAVCRAAVTRRRPLAKNGT